MITSKTNPKIKNLVRLQKASERREQGRILIEGQREIERAQQCGFVIEQLYVCEPLLRVPLRIKADFMETVTEEVEGKHCDQDGYAGEDCQIRGGSDIGSSEVKHASPLRSRNRNTKAQEAQR